MLLVAILLSFLALSAIILIWYKAVFLSSRQQSSPFPALTDSLATARRRLLTEEEKVVIDRYLQFYEEKPPQFQYTKHHHKWNQQYKIIAQTVYMLVTEISHLTEKNDGTYSIRYFMGSTEVHLPHFWIPHLKQHNHIELLCMYSTPFIISLNGHTLPQYIHAPKTPQALFPSLYDNPSSSCSSLKTPEIINIRRETNEEFHFRQPKNIKESVIFCLALLLLFLSLISAMQLQPWLIAGSILLLFWAIWRLRRAIPPLAHREIYRIRGIPKYWGLFGESVSHNTLNISVSSLDVHYPTHWQPYLHYDIGRKTNIDLYQNRQVLRQGKYLSLNDEAKYFPHRYWGRNLVMMCGALAITLLLLVYVPLELPLKLTFAWIKGAQSSYAGSVEELRNKKLKIGDRIILRGNAACSVSINFGKATSPLVPFDCSTIYWGGKNQLTQPHSERILSANALMNDLERHNIFPNLLFSSDNNTNWLPATLDKEKHIHNFSDIVIKVDELCLLTEDCIKLKNILLSLSNEHLWQDLLHKSQDGILEVDTVTIPSIKAKALAHLIENIIATLYYQEIHQAIAAMAKPPQGGFIISSHEGTSLIDYHSPIASLYDYHVYKQWEMLKTLSYDLLKIPFYINGVITFVEEDDQGTCSITLHNESDLVTHWRYLGTNLLFLILLWCLVINTILFFFRITMNLQRINNIQRYYNVCFNINFTKKR